jgi:hypothetical protein
MGISWPADGRRELLGVRNSARSPCPLPTPGGGSEVNRPHKITTSNTTYPLINNHRITKLAGRIDSRVALVRISISREKDRDTGRRPTNSPCRRDVAGLRAERSRLGKEFVDEDDRGPADSP